MAKPKSKIYLSNKEKIVRTKKAIQSFKARANENRSEADKVADWLTSYFGTVAFLVWNAVFFIVWFILNNNVIEGIAIFDPYPYGLLTMIVSLEAIFLAIIVLISQNREARVAELREEVDLYINTHSETEITKMIYLQTLLLEKNGIDISKDEELRDMLESLQSDEIEKELKKQL